MMIKLIGVSICILFCSLLLKDTNRPFAVVLSITGVFILFFTAVNQLKDIVETVLGFSSVSSSTLAYSKLMLKILGIILITKVVCDICRDNGENALASTTAAIAKIIVVSLVLPLFETVIGIIGGLTK